MCNSTWTQMKPTTNNNGDYFWINFYVNPTAALQRHQRRHLTCLALLLYPHLMLTKPYYDNYGTKLVTYLDVDDPKIMWFCRVDQPELPIYIL